MGNLISGEAIQASFNLELIGCIRRIYYLSKICTPAKIWLVTAKVLRCAAQSFLETGK